MAQHRIVLQEPIHDDGIADMRAAGAEVRVLSGRDDPAFADALREADALVVRSTRVDASLLEDAPLLRVIGRHGAGLDTIDLAAAERRGIRVVNTPIANTESVAEYVLAATLHLLRRFDESRARLSAGGFTEDGSLPGQVQRAGLLGREFQGSCVGLVGAGAIGRAVARRAAALGASVQTYDPYADRSALAAEGIAGADDLDELISTSDVLSLHLPATEETRGLFDARRIALMPQGAVLVNAARGGLVDHAALIDAVRAGHLGGAAVDVFAPEPPAPDDPILHEPGVLATPHLAAMTDDAVRRMATDVADAVLHALDES